MITMGIIEKWVNGDMFSTFSTGYYAWRNRDRGSWYVEALVQVFMKYAKCEDLCTMLNRVSLFC